MALVDNELRELVLDKIPDLQIQLAYMKMYKNRWPLYFADHELYDAIEGAIIDLEEDPEKYDIEELFLNVLLV